MIALMCDTQAKFLVVTWKMSDGMFEAINQRLLHHLPVSLHLQFKTEEAPF